MAQPHKVVLKSESDRLPGQKQSNSSRKEELRFVYFAKPSSYTLDRTPSKLAGLAKGESEAVSAIMSDILRAIHDLKPLFVRNLVPRHLAQYVPELYDDIGEPYESQLRKKLWESVPLKLYTLAILHPINRKTTWTLYMQICPTDSGESSGRQALNHRNQTVWTEWKAELTEKERETINMLDYADGILPGAVLKFDVSEGFAELTEIAASDKVWTTMRYELSPEVNERK